MAVRVRPSPIRSSGRRWTPRRTRHAAKAPPTTTSGTVRSRAPSPWPKCSCSWSSSRPSALPPLQVRSPGLATACAGCSGLCLAWDPCAKHTTTLNLLFPLRRMSNVFETPCRPAVKDVSNSSNK